MSRGPRPRTAARLAAVQALYQMELAGIGVEAVIREFHSHRFDQPFEAAPLMDADRGFFAELVRGVVAEQAMVDRAIAERLAERWRLDRLDATLRALLRCGAFELLRRPDVPAEVAIDEYVELAKGFHEPAETGFINGALDAIATVARAAPRASGDDQPT